MGNALSRRDNWFVPYQRSDQNRRCLIYFPHAAGTALAFNHLRFWLPSNVAIFGVQLPGREGRFLEPFARDVRVMAAAIAQAIEKLDHTQVVLFGHSLGALLAYEVAVAAKTTAGMRVQHLVVSALPAPHLLSMKEPLHRASDDELIKTLTEYSQTPDELLLDDELREIIVPRFRADLALAETYKPAQIEPLCCPITALGGDADEEVNLLDLTSWEPYTNSHFEFMQFPGGHFYYHDHLNVLSKMLSRLYT